jgi:hypothetical protein
MFANPKPMYPSKGKRTTRLSVGCCAIAWNDIFLISVKLNFFKLNIQPISNKEAMNK